MKKGSKAPYVDSRSINPDLPEGYYRVKTGNVEPGDLCLTWPDKVWTAADGDGWLVSPLGDDVKYCIAVARRATTDNLLPGAARRTYVVRSSATPEAAPPARDHDAGKGGAILTPNKASISGTAQNSLF